MEMLTGGLKQRPAAAAAPAHLTALWLTTVAALAVHNAEEWLFGLTGWIADRAWMPGASLHGDQSQYGLALIIITAGVLAVAVVAAVFRPAWSAEVLSCIAYALIVNAGSHLAVSVVTWSLMPGTVSGALVLVPLGLIIMRRLPPVRWTTSAVVITVLAAAGSVLGSLLLAGAISQVA